MRPTTFYWQSAGLIGDCHDIRFGANVSTLFSQLDCQNWPAEMVADTDKLHDGIAEVTITFGSLQAIIAGDWLDMGTYAATYQVGENWARGSFAVYACRSSLEQIWFVGTFTRADVTWK